jgi:hypothetical protein
MSYCSSIEVQVVHQDYFPDYLQRKLGPRFDCIRLGEVTPSGKRILNKFNYVVEVSRSCSDDFVEREFDSYGQAIGYYNFLSSKK